jgi:hypothetical protein
MGAQHVLALPQMVEKLKDVACAVVILLMPAQSDVAPVLNILAACKKRIDSGVFRVIVYGMFNHAKVPSLLKQKGCCELLVDGLTQKALTHKLQRHVQIALAKHNQAKEKEQDAAALKNRQNKAKDAKADLALKAKTPAKPVAEAAPVVEKGKIKFEEAVESENDCWLLKSKRDFKYVRGTWLGEMIGPGPSIGSWTDTAERDAKGQEVFKWVARSQPDPFVPGEGAWYFTGKKPEFDWKINRWRFIGELPSLVYRPVAGSTGISFQRFHSPLRGQLEVLVNSAEAKSKLKAIIQSYSDEKRFKDEKKKAPGEFDELSKDEDPAAWGELETGEEEAASDWNDQTAGEDPLAKDWNDQSNGKDEPAKDWDDKSDTEDPESPDWNGTDIGRGNKFNSGRGLGQGQGGSKGYKYDELALREQGEWKSGADAFDKIGMEITLCRVELANKPTFSDVSLLEREEESVTLDAPSAGFYAEEKVSFKVIITQLGKKRDLHLNGVVLSSESQEGSREVLNVSIVEESRPHLGEIQAVFEAKQAELLRFLRDARGE